MTSLTLCPPAAQDQTRSRFERLEGRPLFLADWDRVLFIHFYFPPAVLQPHVPLELDLYDGRAYVSLVAFTQRRLRPTRLAALACLARPLEHAFLNVRTYVRAGKNEREGGIFFNVEWVPNRLACLLGPPLYGLPYRLARLDYRHDSQTGHLRGCVKTGRELRYQAQVERASLPTPCAEGSLDEFLLERYVAFTQRGDRRRSFRIWHAPWPQTPVNPFRLEGDLVEQACPWFREATFAGANYSSGVRDVWIGRPHEA